MWPISLCVCDPNTTSNKITYKSCDTETLYTEMHPAFHAVFVIYVWQSQNWTGLKNAGKILQYQFLYRNVEQCLVAYIQIDGDAQWFY